MSTQVVAGLPADLVAQALAFSPEDGQILVTLANQGKTAVNSPPAGAPRGTPGGPPIQVDVYVGSTRVQTLYHQSLAGNTTRVLRVQMQSSPKCGESRALRAVVDPANVIAEGNDANNDTSVTATRPCPDLAVKDIERNYSGLLNETYSVKITIVNKGTSPSPAHKVWGTSLPSGVWPLSGWPTLVPTHELKALAPGESTTFHTGGSVAAPVHTAVRVILDRDFKIDELDESNNFVDKYL
jgi:subtilase family serine protease